MTCCVAVAQKRLEEVVPQSVVDVELTIHACLVERGGYQRYELDHLGTDKFRHALDEIAKSLDSSSDQLVATFRRNRCG